MKIQQFGEPPVAPVRRRKAHVSALDTGVSTAAMSASGSSDSFVGSATFATAGAISSTENGDIASIVGFVLNPVFGTINQSENRDVATMIGMAISPSFIGATESRDAMLAFGIFTSSGQMEVLEGADFFLAASGSFPVDLTIDPYAASLVTIEVPDQSLAEIGPYDASLVTIEVPDPSLAEIGPYDATLVDL